MHACACVYNAKLTCTQTNIACILQTFILNAIILINHVPNLKPQRLQTRAQKAKFHSYLLSLATNLSAKPGTRTAALNTACVHLAGTRAPAESGSDEICFG